MGLLTEGVCLAENMQAAAAVNLYMVSDGGLLPKTVVAKLHAYQFGQLVNILEVGSQPRLTSLSTISHLLCIEAAHGIGIDLEVIKVSTDNWMVHF